MVLTLSNPDFVKIEHPTEPHYAERRAVITSNRPKKLEDFLKMTDGHYQQWRASTAAEGMEFQHQSKTVSILVDVVRQAVDVFVVKKIFGEHQFF